MATKGCMKVMKTAKWLCVAMCVWAEAALERGEETARKRVARLAELEAKRWEWSEEEHQEWRRLVELD